MSQKNAKNRDQLANLLIQKFKNRFHEHNDGTNVLEATITKEVNYMLRDGSATEQDLKDLEKKIETVIK